MANINEIICLGSDANTGISRCTTNPGLLKVAIAVPPNTYILNSDISGDIATFINGKLYNDSTAVRWYPLPHFLNGEANNTEAGTQSFNYGNSIRVGQDKSVWTFQSIHGDICGYKALEKFNGKNENYHFFFMDHLGQLWGHSKVVSGVLRHYAFSMDDIYVPTFKLGNNSATPEYRISFMFSDDTQLRANLSVIQTGLSWGDMLGVTSVDLELVGSVGSNGTVTVKATTGCGGANLGDLFGATLATADAWILMNSTTGTEITLSGVTYNSTLKQYTIDPDQTDTDYDIGEPAILKLEPIGDLVALGVAYYETPTGLTYELN